MEYRRFLFLIARGVAPSRRRTPSMRPGTCTCCIRATTGTSSAAGCSGASCTTIPSTAAPSRSVFL